MNRTKYTDKQIALKMLTALTCLRSRRKTRFCKNIINGKVSVFDANKEAGLFFQAVLKGDFPTAMARATAEQFYLLETLPHKQIKMQWGFKYVFG